MTFIKFNDDNIWEYLDDNGSNNNMVVFYKRVPTPQALHTTIKIDKDINEDQLSTSTDSNFNYNDWKAFMGEEMLRKIASDFNEERYSLPMIYWAIYILGLVNMKRIRSTKYIFEKRKQP